MRTHARSLSEPGRRVAALGRIRVLVLISASPGVQAASAAPATPLASWLLGAIAAGAIACAMLLAWRWRRAARERRQLQAILDSLPFDLWACGPDGRYRFQNAVSLRHWGAHVGETPADVELDPATRARWEDHNRRALAGELVSGRAVYEHDGESIEVTSLLCPLRSGGRNRGLVGINVGIPDLRRGLASADFAERNHALLQAMYDSSPETIIATDAQRRIRIVNPAFERLFGYSRDEVIGGDTRMLYVDPAEYDRVGRDYGDRSLDEDPRARTYTVRFRTRAGREFYAETVTDLLYDANGAHVGYVGFIRDVTERVVAERELRDIFGNMAEGLCRSTPDGRILRANPSLVRLFGYDSEQALIRSVTDVAGQCYVDPEDRSRMLEALARDGRVENLEVEMYRPGTGERIWVSENARAVRDDAGKLLYCDVSLQDISERKHAEEQLRHSEALHRTMISTMAEGVVLHADDGSIVSCNPAAQAILGLSEDQIVGRKPRDPRWCAIHEDGSDWPGDEHPAMISLRTGKALRGQVMGIRDPERGLRWISVNSVPMEGPAGTTAAIATFADITERREAQETLRAQEERYRLLVESSSAIFWEGDPDTLAFTFVTREAEDLLGYPVSAWTGSPGFWVEHMHPEDREWAPDLCREASRDRRQHEFDYRMIAHDGRVVWLRDIVTVVARDDGSARNIGVMIDITATKEAEEALAQSERRYRELYHRTPVMLHSIDSQGRLVAVSGYWLEHLGYTEKDVLGRYSTEFLTEESRRQAIEERLPRFYREGRVHNVPFQVVKANGEVIDVLLSAIADFEQGGHAGYSLAVMTDVTDQRWAESRLRETAAVFENTADGVFITDTDGVVRDVNRAFTQITGYERDTVIGANPRIWKSAQHDHEFFHSMWRSIERSGHWRGEIWNRSKSGEDYPAWMTINQVLDDEGELNGYVAVFSDISKVKDAEARLEHLAHHDSLTDLPNRLLINDRLEHAMQRARRYQNQLALVFIDLDRFKHINDSLGHTLGDDLLRQAGERLASCLRTDDTVGRIGGDEFTLLLEDIADADACVVVANKVLERFSDPFELSGNEVYLTPSLGIALFPDNGEDADTLLRNADAAMYQAKHFGGNTYAFYTSRLTARAYERVQLEGSMRRALERNEFTLRYQPQVDMVSGAVVGAEALLRWEHPEMGLIGPDRFIPVAEETGTIVAIGSWVLAEACRTATQLIEVGIPLERISVNVAGPQIRRGDLVAEVRAALEGAGLAPQRLELEVTESFIMEQAERSLEVLHDLRSLGVRLAIDDFGTGYSSLAYLKRLPIDMLKIDQSFVRDVPDEGNNVGICRAVISLARNLELEVIAEGVESEAQRDFLIAADCHRAQGYLFSRPLGVDEFMAWCADGAAERQGGARAGRGAR